MIRKRTPQRNRKIHWMYREYKTGKKKFHTYQKMKSINQSANPSPESPGQNDIPVRRPDDKPAASLYRRTFHISKKPVYHLKVNERFPAQIKANRLRQ